jgi:hypothetical protein
MRNNRNKKQQIRKKNKANGKSHDLDTADKQKTNEELTKQRITGIKELKWGKWKIK